MPSPGALWPAMVTKDDRPWFCVGVMGGDMQPQGHVQVLVNVLDFGMNVQAAGEAPGAKAPRYSRACARTESTYQSAWL